MAAAAVPQLNPDGAVLLAGAAPVIATTLLAAGGVIPPVPAGLVIAAWCLGALWLRHYLQRSVKQAVPPPAAAARGVPQEFLERLPDPVILLNSAREIVAVNRHARDVLDVGLLGRDLALSLRHPDVLSAVETVAAGLPAVTEEVTLPLPVPRTFTLHAGTLHAGTLHAGTLHAGTLHAGTLHAEAMPASVDPHSPRVVLVLRDETRAKRAEQSRADFVANASHELRSPLSALIGFIETLRGPASDDAPARDRFLGVMHAETQRMARLVEDLMSLSRVEINEHIPPRHHVDLPEALSGVAEALAVRAAKRQMTIEVEHADDLPDVVGDRDQLIQVFHNLVDNAVKYARAGTPIRIVATPVDRLPGTQLPAVAVTVEDRGDGIEALHLPRLTERFYRADEGRSRRLGGTGLGLAIVKHIVSRHRGRLMVESTVGEGSRFTVYLPAAMTTATAANTATGGARLAGDFADVIKR